MAAAGDPPCAAVAARWINPAQNPEWFTPASTAAAASAPARPSQSFAGAGPGPGRTLQSTDAFGIDAQPLQPLQAPAAVVAHSTDAFRFAASDFASPDSQGIGNRDDVLANQPPTPAVPDKAGQLTGSSTAPDDDEEATKEFQDILALLTAGRP